MAQALNREAAYDLSARNSCSVASTLTTNRRYGILASRPTKKRPWEADKLSHRLERAMIAVFRSTVTSEMSYSASFRIGTVVCGEVQSGHVQKNMI